MITLATTFDLDCIHPWHAAHWHEGMNGSRRQKRVPNSWFIFSCLIYRWPRLGIAMNHWMWSPTGSFYLACSFIFPIYLISIYQFHNEYLQGSLLGWQNSSHFNVCSVLYMMQEAMLPKLSLPRAQKGYIWETHALSTWAKLQYKNIVKYIWGEMEKAFNSIQFDCSCFHHKIANNSGYFLPYILSVKPFTTTLSESQMCIISIPKPPTCIKSHTEARGCWKLPAAAYKWTLVVFWETLSNSSKS